MSLQLSIPQLQGALNILLGEGDLVFVVGPNGAGKSSLVSHIYRQHSSVARRISAHRQNWIHSNALSMTGEQARQTEQNMRTRDGDPTARWRDDMAAARSNLAIFKLIDAQNVISRKIADAYRAGRLDEADKYARDPAPIDRLNEVLRESNVPIVLSVEENDALVARKKGGSPYSAAELSDGERSALFVVAEMLTAPPGALIIIDEPERHLHRSIVLPMLDKLIEERSDCHFVVATHDVGLVAFYRDTRTILVRECHYNGITPSAWDIDVLGAGLSIDEKTRVAILGARRRIVFVEGCEGSLDRPLYSLLFPDVSIVPQENCRQVEASVRAMRAARAEHDLCIHGIIDGDARDDAELAKLRAEGVHALPVYSVESVLYHPEMQRRLAVRYSQVTGDDAEVLLMNAEDAALRDLATHERRLCARVVEKDVRFIAMGSLPSSKEIQQGSQYKLDIDTASILKQELQRFGTWLKHRDLVCLTGRYPVRETPALKSIASAIGFPTTRAYEKAAMQCLHSDVGALQWARSLFGSLWEALSASGRGSVGKPA